MDVARHLGRMRRPIQGSNSTEGQHLQALAQGGSARAQAMLQGPEIPHGMEDLWERFLRLDGMREIGQWGPKRFTPPFLKAAVDLFGWILAPHEIEALVSLDAACLNPGPG